MGNVTTTVVETVKQIKTGDKVFIHSVAAAPQMLIDAMVARSGERRDLEIYHLHTEATAPMSSGSMMGY